jgi:hypothetical protein
MGGGTAAVGRRDALNRVFEGFENDLVEGDGLPIFVRHGGNWVCGFVAALAPVYVGDLASGRPLLAAHGLTVVCADLPAYGRSGKPTSTDDPVRIPSAPAPAACARQWAP